MHHHKDMVMFVGLDRCKRGLLDQAMEAGYASWLAEAVRSSMSLSITCRRQSSVATSIAFTFFVWLHRASGWLLCETRWWTRRTQSLIKLGSPLLMTHTQSSLREGALRSTEAMDCPGLSTCYPMPPLGDLQRKKWVVM